jgi:hypothetical protein
MREAYGPEYDDDIITPPPLEKEDEEVQHSLRFFLSALPLSHANNTPRGINPPQQEKEKKETDKAKRKARKEKAEEEDSGEGEEEVSRTCCRHQQKYKCAFSAVRTYLYSTIVPYPKMHLGPDNQGHPQEADLQRQGQGGGQDGGSHTLTNLSHVHTSVHKYTFTPTISGIFCSTNIPSQYDRTLPKNIFRT